MSLINFLPVPLMVGVLAFLWMVVAAKLELLGWVAFITWGAYFLSGFNTRGAVRETISYVIGLVFGWAIVVLGTSLVPVLGADYAFPAAVFVAGVTIVLLELVPWFDLAPGYFLGAAVFFAAGGGSKSDFDTNMTALRAALIPGLLGVALGMLTGYLRGKIFAMEGEKDPLTKKAAS